MNDVLETWQMVVLLIIGIFIYLIPFIGRFLKRHKNNTPDNKR